MLRISLTRFDSMCLLYLTTSNIAGVSFFLKMKVNTHGIMIRVMDVMLHRDSARFEVQEVEERLVDPNVINSDTMSGCLKTGVLQCRVQQSKEVDEAFRSESFAKSELWWGDLTLRANCPQFVDIFVSIIILVQRVEISQEHNGALPALLRQQNFVQLGDSRLLIPVVEM